LRPKIVIFHPFFIHFSPYFSPYFSRTAKWRTSSFLDHFSSLAHDLRNKNWMNPVCEIFSATSDAKYCSVAIGSAILKSWGSVLHQVKLYKIYTAQKRQHCEKWSFPGKSRFSRRFWQCRFFSSNCTCDAVQHLSVSQFKCTRTCDAVQGLSVSQLRFFTPANPYLYRLSVCRALSVCVCVCVCACVCFCFFA
jgi:hypothetical protein